ncbi:hypothetical protein KOW79_006881 [Hemibagrus wyckioides]|uniref:Protein translocase subunit SecA n=1 Tax=Hemibagrus wyckioides TaxID=337641 RepID=A0A9D3NYU6_9TELE|nr:hypothetical protein KOW79_006881 [Hemibagrus wyckioides]
MGFLGGQITVNNCTPFKWTVCIETQTPWLFPDRYMTLDIEPNKETQQYQRDLIKWGKAIYLRVKYGQCSETECHKDPDLWYLFNPRDDPCFTIRESGDHWYIHLDCNVNYEEKKSTCPNYGKIKDDAREEEQRRRRDEEQRRQAQLERERRIEEQIKRESELAAKKLSQATETLKQKERLRGHELHHQTYIMQQPLDTEIEEDEVTDTEKKFMELLLEFQAIDEEDPEETLAGRMKTLQNELMVEYCKKHNLSSSCVFSFDTSVGYETLPLQDRLTVLEAVMYLFFEEDENDHKHKHDRDFLLDVLELFQDDHPSLAFNLLQSVLQTDIQLSTQSKDILCRIAFNNTWKLPEITDFMRYVVEKDKDQVQAILHIAQTYKLEYEIVLHALDSPDPPRRLKWHVDTETDKNANTIISEMRNSNYPENVLTILEDVLLYLEMELPKHKRTDLHKNEIQHVKKMVKELDFTNPDRQVLKSVLVQMSVAVKMCSALTIQRGKEEIVIEGYLPRLTQLAALMVFLLPKSETNTGCLLEIGTGEGKSCILAMLTVIHAIRGVKVDIVTSSPVLARRDLEEWSKLYNMFDITSSAVPPMLNDVSSEEQDDLTQEAYKQDVVYSTVGTFAADTLKQEFEKKTSRGDRKFELVLVDEVDYMTLDNGVQITFLSHESSGLQHLEQVLASIWAIISACRPIEVEETGETMWTTRVQNFHTAALIAMIGSDTNDTFSPLEILLPGIELGFYSEEDFENLKVSINEEGEKEHGAIENEAWKTIMAKTGIEQQYDLLSVLEMGMEHKVAFNCYIYQSETRIAFQFGEQKTKTDQNINMLLLENGKSCEILSENLLIEATISEVKSKIKYSKQCSSEKDKESLVIPSFLEKYLENQLPLFVENALKAIQMTKGREYMIERSLSAQGIDVDEDGEHMYHAIIPVDFQASGMLEKRKRWGDGLQQFLEMKHQLTLSPLSNVTNYMSNSNFFKRYLRGKGIFGVSGTLGGDADKGFLARHYKTDSYVIPAHQRQKVTELPAVQVRGGTEQWIQTICATVTRVSKRGQVVLVVCEDVNTANALNNEIAAETKHLVTMYTMSESHNIENQEFNKGQIIITTNLGGRGTDIKVTEEPATDLEVHILTKSNLLEGKGICITVVDAQGLHSEKTFPGTDPAAGTIKLLLKRTPLTSQGNEGMLNKQTGYINVEDVPQSDHTDIVLPDGSRQTCLFHALIQAKTHAPSNVMKQKVKELRRKVSEEVLLKPSKYVDAVKIQNMFNMTNRLNKFKIQNGVRECDMEQYVKYTKNKTPKQIINEYELGKVGDHKCLLAMEKPTAGVEAQHIPPKITWIAVLHLMKTNPEISISLEQKNEEAFYLVKKMKHDPDGKQQLCMNTLYTDHRRALSSCNTAVSRACRHFLTSTFSSGDTEKALKLSLMMAHPQCSDNIRNHLGIRQHFRTCDLGLPVTDRNEYYKKGFKDVVKKYSKWDLINQEQTIRLLQWVNKDLFLDTSTVEYKEIINAIKDVKKKRRESLSRQK